MHTNSPSVNKIMANNSDISFHSNIKVLGINWNTHSDNLSISVQHGIFESKIPKRTVVSDTANIFDPFGWLLPVTVRGRLVVQSLWKDEISCYAPLSGELCNQWLDIHNDVQNLISELKVPRKIYCNKITSLHIFADASSEAYGAVAYFASDDGIDFVLLKLVCHISIPFHYRSWDLQL